MDAGGSRHTVDRRHRRADAGDDNGGGRCVDDERATSMAMEVRCRWRWTAWIDVRGVRLTSAVGEVVAGRRCAMVAVGIFAAGWWQADEATAGTGDGGRGVLHRRWSTVAIRLTSGGAAAGIDDGWLGSIDRSLTCDGDEGSGDRRRARRRGRGLRRPDLAAVVDVDLRLRWIWDGLDLVVMMDSLDCPTRCSSSVGFSIEDSAFVVVVAVVDVGIFFGRRRAEQHRQVMAAALMGSSALIGPRLCNSSTTAMAIAFHGDGGAPYRCSMDVPHS
ncbi:hypothetical protein ACLOJK_024294, partial [Asimina triloba]